MEDDEKQPENIAQTIAKIVHGATPLRTTHNEMGDEIPGAFIGTKPEGWEHDVIDHERLLGRPRRAMGKRTALTIPAFATLYNAMPEHGVPRIYRHPTVDATGARVDLNVEAVLNDDEASQAGWRDLRVALRLVRTPNWLRWTGLFGKPVHQFRLARILEEYCGDVVSPAGADLLKLALDLEATRSAQFKGSFNLQNRDTGLTFVEKTETTIAVPREIVILLKPYQGHDMEYPVPAFLRYELAEGKVVFTIEPKNWDQWLESMYDDAVKALERALPDAVWVDGLFPEERR